jgi:transcriptional regulator with XRE-family HTH domain
MAPPDTYTQRVAAAVQAAIDQAGTTAHAVAKGTGIPQATLSRRLTGNSSFLIRELDQIAQHLHVPVEQLTAPTRNAA